MIIFFIHPHGQRVSDLVWIDTSDYDFAGFAGYHCGIPELRPQLINPLVEERSEHLDGERALLEFVEGTQPDGEHAEADDDDAGDEGGAPHHAAVGLDDNSIAKIFAWNFWLGKRLEIPFWFCDMSKLPIFELSISVGNLKPKLKWYFKQKNVLNCHPGWAPSTWAGTGACAPGRSWSGNCSSGDIHS